MINFVPFKDLEGVATYINPLHVSVVVNYSYFSRIFTSDVKFFDVKEPILEVIDKLKVASPYWREEHERSDESSQWSERTEQPDKDRGG